MGSKLAISKDSMKNLIDGMLCDEVVQILMHNSELFSLQHVKHLRRHCLVWIQLV
jgi:hypothetical protein